MCVGLGEGESMSVCLWFGWEFLHMGIYFLFDVSNENFHIEGQFVELGDYHVPDNLVNCCFLHFFQHEGDRADGSCCQTTDSFHP